MITRTLDLELDTTTDNNMYDFTYQYNQYSRVICGDDDTDMIPNTEEILLSIDNKNNIINKINQTLNTNFNINSNLENNIYNTIFQNNELLSEFNLNIKIINKSDLTLYISSMNNIITKIRKDKEYINILDNRKRNESSMKIMVIVSSSITNQIDNTIEEVQSYYSEIDYSSLRIGTVHYIPELNVFIGTNEEKLKQSVKILTGYGEGYKIGESKSDIDTIREISKIIYMSNAILINDPEGKLGFNHLRVYHNGNIYTSHALKNHKFNSGIYYIKSDKIYPNKIRIFKQDINIIKDKIIKNGYCYIQFGNEKMLFSNSIKNIKSIVDKYEIVSVSDTNKLVSPTILEYKERIEKLEEELNITRSRHEDVIYDKNKKIKELEERLNVYINREKEQTRLKTNEYMKSKYEVSYKESNIKSITGISISVISLCVALISLYKKIN